MLDLAHVVIAAFALTGTWLQAHASVVALRETDPDGAQTFTAVDGLKTEWNPLRHPRRWYARQREVQDLLADSPRDAQRYWRVWRQLIAWVLLSVASLVAFVEAAFLR